MSLYLQKQKDRAVVIRGVNTAKCMGLLLGGPVPPEGFRLFASICRAHKLKFNPQCKMWYVFKEDYEEPSIALRHVHGCAMDVFAQFGEKYQETKMQYDPTSLMKPPKVKPPKKDGGAPQTGSK